MTNDERNPYVERKRLAAGAAHVKSKADREHVLLRLRPGSLAQIDQGRAQLDMTRSAYIELLLAETASALSTASCAPKLTKDATGSVGDEFEALFGAGA